MSEEEEEKKRKKKFSCITDEDGLKIPSVRESISEFCADITIMPSRKRHSKTDDTRKVSSKAQAKDPSLLYSFIVNKNKKHILDLLRNKGIEEKTFHHIIDYEFKWAKYRFLEQNSKIPRQFASLLFKYFKYLMKSHDFKIFSNSIRIFSCSDFRVKYLKQGDREKVYLRLKKEGLIKEYTLKDLLNSNLPFLHDLLVSTAEIEDFMKENSELNKDRHDRLEALLLLDNYNVLAIEPPFFDRSSYITGHIDLVMYANSTPLPTLFTSDYKPNIIKSHGVVEFLPQLCMYGLLMRKTLGFKESFEIKGLIFNRNYVWIFSPDLIFELPKIIDSYYNEHYFPIYKDIFGNTQDYFLISWSFLSNLQCLRDPNIVTFKDSIVYELSRLLNIQTKDFNKIGSSILKVIDRLKGLSSLSNQIDHLQGLEKVVALLFLLDFRLHDQLTFRDFLQQFRFNIFLWNSNPLIKRYLIILHKINILCFIFSVKFRTQMFPHGEKSKYYLLLAYFATKKNGENVFTSMEVLYLFGKSRSFSDIVTPLMDQNLVKLLGFGKYKRKEASHKTLNYYYFYGLTKRGILQAEVVLQKFSLEFKNEFDAWKRKLKSRIKKYTEFKNSTEIIDQCYFSTKGTYNKKFLDIKIPRIDINSRYFRVGSAWKKYLIIIGYIVSYKESKLKLLKLRGLNSSKDFTFVPFTIFDFQDALEETQSHIGFRLTYLKDHGYLDCLYRGKLIYWLTDKGKKEIQKLPNYHEILSSNVFDKNIESKINSKKEFADFTVPLKINDNLFRKDNRYKLWLNLAYYVSSNVKRSEKGRFTHKHIQTIIDFSSSVISNGLIRLCKRGLLYKPKLSFLPQYITPSCNIYKMTKEGYKLAIEYPTFNDMILKTTGIPIINRKLFARGEKWKIVLIVCEYIASQNLDNIVTSIDLSRLMNTRRDTAGESLKDLYDKGFMSRFFLQEGSRGYYSYFFTEEGKKTLNLLPSYKNILKKINI